MTSFAMDNIQHEARASCRQLARPHLLHFPLFLTLTPFMDMPSLCTLETGRKASSPSSSKTRCTIRSVRAATAAACMRHAIDDAWIPLMSIPDPHPRHRIMGLVMAASKKDKVAGKHQPSFQSSLVSHPQDHCAVAVCCYITTTHRQLWLLLWLTRSLPSSSDNWPRRVVL